MKMTIKEQATAVFEALLDGYDVYVSRDDNPVYIKAISIIDEKIVGFIPNSDGAIKAIDITNDNVYRIKPARPELVYGRDVNDQINTEALKSIVGNFT